MIKSIEVTNDLGDILLLELAKPKASGLAVVNVDGLGPPKATINLSGGASFDGRRFNSAKAEGRNILLSLVYRGTPLIEDTRHLTYKMFPIRRRVKIKVETDRRVGETYGYIESNEPNIFSAQQGTTVSVICESPYFTDAASGSERRVFFYGIEPMFEFPFSNESLMTKMLEMGRYTDLANRTITYNGDVETGVLIEATMYGSVQNLSITNLLTGGGMIIDHAQLQSMLGTGLSNGDSIQIDTRRGQRSAFLIRGGVRHNIMNALGKNTAWITLDLGDNILQVNASLGAGNARLEVRYHQLFEGV